jgi:hypothetical protein
MKGKDRRDPRKSERTPSRVLYFENVMSSKIQPAHLPRNIFGSAPSKITQEPFDANVKHLLRLARLRPGEKAEARDLTTVGRAVAAVQYLSCLMYEENENPIFSAWTPDRGGGPPSLWEFGGHLYTNRWLELNVSFLKDVLRAWEVGDVLGRAVERLIDQPEHAKATEVLGDLPLCEETLTARCAALPRLLGTTQEPGKLLEW